MRICVVIAALALGACAKSKEAKCRDFFARAAECLVNDGNVSERSEAMCERPEVSSAMTEVEECTSAPDCAAFQACLDRHR
ncbi:MAG TPA: hypothetical protein VL463_28260 [Kofleriaceae bacterium]|nr:hypothetical protein [Kofleriaceae bacterium]